MSSGSLSYPAGETIRAGRATGRAGARLGWLRRRPELLILAGAAALLNLWGLSINGWANTYYSAAVRSMASSWHDFLFASLDRSGLMTVDKPPLSLWIQALSARAFGFHPLSLLIPQALMGVAATAVVYDLVRRPFGRPAGFVAGLALATTPIVVAVSRHNNPDELLVLCCVAALWCAARALETRQTRWLILTGIFVGLGFETKMGVALLVVPGIGIAWLWTASPLRLRAIRQLLAGAAAMVIVGGAWPVLVMLTPAADRPWISGTSDNSIWSLILGYNGIGRVSGQSGAPAGLGGGGTMFGGPTGVLRLLQSGLGDQAGWLLGFAAVAGLGLVAATRLRRHDPRTGWALLVGGAFLTTAVLFSFAQGIFHPYYVSLLAPFSAALIGAGVGQMLSGHTRARLLAPAAIAAGVGTELVVLGELSGALSWARVALLVIALPAAALLALPLRPRVRFAVVAVAIGALFAAPATWAAETLGHATSGTFPAGGPASAAVGPGPQGSGGLRGPATTPGGFPGGAPGAGRPPLPAAGLPGGPFGGPGPQRAGGGFAGPFGGDNTTLEAAIRYASAHGGGTIAVASQSTAAAAILSSDANVAGIGGFSGRESTVSVSWVAAEVRSDHLRWVIADQAAGAGLPGDTRAGSSVAIAAVARACKAVRLPTSSATAQGTRKIYDCAGRASELAQVAHR